MADNDIGRARALLHEITPPVLARGARAFRNRVVRPEPDAAGEVQPASYYDEAYTTREAYHVPYFKSPYYFLWSVIADRLARSAADRIIDVGCGPGQVASLLRDRGFVHYIGLDFSGTSVAMARDACPSFEFVQADVTSTEALAKLEYDWVLALELLEHLDDDLSVLMKVRSGAHLIATVPNFTDPSHVRYFQDAAAVQQRYEPLLEGAAVDTFQSTYGPHLFFLLEGTRR